MLGSMERYASWLESCLCCFMERDRASAIVGDLQEASAARNGTGFTPAAVRLVGLLYVRLMVLCLVSVVLATVVAMNFYYPAKDRQTSRPMPVMGVSDTVKTTTTTTTTSMQGQTAKTGTRTNIDWTLHAPAISVPSWRAHYRLVRLLMALALLPLAVRFGLISRVTLLALPFVVTLFLKVPANLPHHALIVPGCLLAILLVGLSTAAWRKASLTVTLATLAAVSSVVVPELLLVIFASCSSCIMLAVNLVRIRAGLEPYPFTCTVSPDSLGFAFAVFIGLAAAASFICMGCSWLHSRRSTQVSMQSIAD